MNMTFSLLNNLSISDTKNYGRKAAALGELAKAGLLVPNGFAISTEAYSQFLSYNRFPYSTEDYLVKSHNIIEFILEGTFPSAITDTLYQYFEDLCSGIANKSFAVRSSSSCEDSENYSMAGIFSSYISLDSFALLIDSIKKCYASLFSDKALSLMIQNNIPFANLKMGVVVQEFIQGGRSGVAFSADTVKMDPDVIVINSVNGICAEFVEGKSLSSLYKINKANCEIIDSLIPSKAPALSRNELSQLHKSVILIENILGKYQDIEWTIDDSGLYILQSRPITTFRSRNHPPNWFTHDGMNDTLLLFEDKPLMPLQQEIKVLWHNATCKGWDFSSKGKNGRFKICNGYFYQAVDEGDQDKRAGFRSWMEELYAEGKNIFQDVQLPQIIFLREKLRHQFNKELPPEELADLLQKSKQLLELSVEINMSAVDGGIIPLKAFEKYCNGLYSGLSKNEIYDLVYGISKLSEEREAVIELALLVRQNDSLVKLFSAYPYDEILYYHLKNNDAAKELLKQIDQYIEEYGLMAVNGQWQFDSPVILEQPWAIIGKIRACLDIDSDLFYESRKESLKNKERLIKKLTAGMNDIDKAEFLARLKGAEKAFLVNDDHCFYLDLSGFGFFRLALAKITSLFISRGIIEKNEDINFFTLNEIDDILKIIQDEKLEIKYHGVINRRKNEYELQRKVIPPAYIGNKPFSDSNKETQARHPAENLTIIKGVSGLQRKVTGKVKVITDNKDIHLKEPAILVMKHGHLCYFLPFLSKVIGLIYDEGSPYDHPGIIARELSIPSLYNTRIATKDLKDGDEVELDGIAECVVIKNKLNNSLNHGFNK